jgi:hypothetical protein
VNRRSLLAAMAAAPVLAIARTASARDYKDAAEVAAAIEALAAAADARLAALAGAYAPAGPFVRSARADLARHAAERARLPLGALSTRAEPPGGVDDPRSLPRLRTALEELMHAHAEGLPALKHRASVQRLGEHMSDLSRLVTIVDLWITAAGGDD